MLNEGVILSDTKSLVKSEMVRQLWRLGPTTPVLWERSVFHALTGVSREEVDWGFEDNQAGAFLWVRSFDQLIGELIEDGYILEAEGADGRRILAPADAAPLPEQSFLDHPAERALGSGPAG